VRHCEDVRRPIDFGFPDLIASYSRQSSVDSSQLESPVAPTNTESAFHTTKLEQEMGIFYERDGSIAIVTIDRVEVANVIDAPTAIELADAFRRFEAEESASVAVLTGAGGTFCAGADLKAMRSGDPERVTRLAPEGDGPVGPTRMLLSKPVIAAVEGHAVAGGLELAVWCDLRVAAEDAVFGVYCRRWGIPLMDGGTVRLARLLGHSHALDLILTGRGVCGEEALRMGLANRLVLPGEALPVAVALAQEIATKPQAALRSDRRSSYEQWSLGLEDALAGEYRHGMATLQTGEMLTGLDDYASGGWRAEPGV
jgi:enoyl-CoA hydratase